MNLGIETETLEFKKKLYFGVKPDGTVVGQVVTEESLWEVSNKQTYPCINCTNTGMQGYFFESLY